MTSVLKWQMWHVDITASVCTPHVLVCHLVAAPFAVCACGFALACSARPLQMLPVLALPLQYKFIVDGDWKYDPNQPAMYDEIGNVNNVIEVQEYVPENLENVSGFDPPPSPPSRQVLCEQQAHGSVFHAFWHSINPCKA